jgi:hypothetical protein
LAGLVFALSFAGGPALINPLRSEQDAFRLFLWVAVVVAILLGIVFLVRAL